MPIVISQLGTSLPGPRDSVKHVNTFVGLLPVEKGESVVRELLNNEKRMSLQFSSHMSSLRRVSCKRKRLNESGSQFLG